MFAYNTAVHGATNFKPYELVFGRLARTPSSFPQGEELETYGSYLLDLIVRLSEIQKIAARNLVREKDRSALSGLRRQAFDLSWMKYRRLAGVHHNQALKLRTCRQGEITKIKI